MTRQGDAFCIERCPRRGRHLLATASLSMGHRICSELPIARALSAEQVTQRCHSCWRPLQTSLRCSRCRFAHYCSFQCQKAHWQQHKSACSVIERICIPRRIQPTPSLLLLFEVVVKQPSDPLSGMVSNWDCIGERRKVEFMQMAVLLTEMVNAVPDFHHAHSLESLAELFARHHSNAFTITDGELQPIGIGLYPQPVHFLNHSCRPNAVVVFEPLTGRAVVKASRAIAPKEEITIAYCDLIKETKVRRAELQDQYCFLCNCASCQGPEESELVRSTVRLQNMFLKELDSENYEAAEEILSRIENKTVYRYAPIQMGLHFLKLGKLRVFLNLPKAEECLDRALQLLSKLLMESDPVLDEAEKLRGEAISLRC